MSPDAIVRWGNGGETVLNWIRVLHRGTADGALWAALTDELRLAVSQLYLMSVGSGNDDARAARLARLGSTDSSFQPMLHRQCQAWRRTFLSLARGADLIATVPVGSDMEMVTVAGRPAQPGCGDRQPPLHRFLVQHDRHGTALAAIGHKLLMPGWPPIQWSIPNLLES